MATYKSKPVSIGRPIEDVYARIADIAAYQKHIDALPDEARQKIGDVEFTDDSISIHAAPVGQLKFVVKERVAPSKVTLEAAQSPVPLKLIVALEPDGDSSTTATSIIDVEIPAMLRPLIGGKLQEASDKFGELLQIFFA